MRLPTRPLIVLVCAEPLVECGHLWRGSCEPPSTFVPRLSLPYVFSAVSYVGGRPWPAPAVRKRRVHAEQSFATVMRRLNTHLKVATSLKSEGGKKERSWVKYTRIHRDTVGHICLVPFGLVGSILGPGKYYTQVTTSRKEVTKPI